MSRHIVVLPRKTPTTSLEIAQQAAEDAQEDLEVARVRFAGAQARLRLLQEHEEWKRHDAKLYAAVLYHITAMHSERLSAEQRAHLAGAIVREILMRK